MSFLSRLNGSIINMYCAECKIQIESGKFCPKCGKQLNSESIAVEDAGETFQNKKLVRNKIFKGCIFLCAILTIGLLAAHLMQSSSKRFMKLLDAGMYEKAQEYYGSNIEGDAKREAELQALLTDKVSTIYEDFNKENLTYQDAVEQMDSYAPYAENIVQQTKNALAELNISKESYKKGETYFAEEDYKNAMAAYHDVITADTNYDDAKKNFDKCYEIVVNEAITSADIAAQKGNYIEAAYQFHDIENYIKEEDAALFEERNEIYTDRFRTSIEAALNNMGAEVRSVSYQDTEITYDEIQNIEIVNLTSDEAGMIANVNISLTDGLTTAVIPYEISYYKDQVWQVKSITAGEMLSLATPVYAVEERKTRGGRYIETTADTYHIRLYNKADDTLAAIISTYNGLEREYKYVDGILNTVIVYQEYDGYDGTENYNDEGKIVSSYKRYLTGHTESENYSYDEAGHLIRYTMYEGSTLTDVIDYTYENNMLKNKRTIEDGIVTEELTYHYDENNYLIKMNCMTGFSSGSQYYKTYYYQNDVNGNPLEVIAYYDDSGAEAYHVIYTYYENGEKESFTQYIAGTPDVAQVWYYDVRGNRVRLQDFSYASLSSMVYETNIYYEYDDQNRQIKWTHYDDNGEMRDFEEIEYCQMTDEELLTLLLDGYARGIY